MLDHATTTTPEAPAAPRRPLVPEQRIAFRADWGTYEGLGRALGDRAPVRLAFDGEWVELMSPSEDHDELRNQLGLIVRGLAAGLGIGCRGCGSATRKQPPQRGVEPDDSFYLSPEKCAAAARRRGRKPDPSAPPGPVPDLAVEIDLSPSALDRPSIYAALGVPEVWRYDGERVVIERLEGGGYRPADESGWLNVRPEEVGRFLEEEYADDLEFLLRVAAWARDALAPRRNV